MLSLYLTDVFYIKILKTHLLCILPDNMHTQLGNELSIFLRLLSVCWPLSKVTEVNYVRILFSSLYISILQIHYIQYKLARLNQINQI